MARPTRPMVLAAAAVVVAAAIGGGVAYVATAHSTPSTPDAAAAAPAAAPHEQGKHGRQAGGLLGRIQHGEFTTASAAGGSETMDLQRGVITTVDPGSVTVRSADGYTATYAITPATAVAPARGTAARGAAGGAAAGAPSGDPAQAPADGTAPAGGAAPAAGDVSSLRTDQPVQVLASKTETGVAATRITPIKAAA